MSSGYHPYTWYFEQPTTDRNKLVGTTKATLEMRSNSKIDMQLGSSLNIGGIMTFTSDAGVELKKSSSMYVGGNVYLTSDARLHLDKDSYIKAETRIPSTHISWHTSDNPYIPNHGIRFIESSTQSKSTGPRFYVKPPTTAGQKLKIVMATSFGTWINFNCSSTANYATKRTGLYNFITGKSSGLHLKLTTDFQFTGAKGGVPAHIDLISMSTGTWIIADIKPNTSITAVAKCWTISSDS